jgi:hypothetical protein
MSAMATINDGMMKKRANCLHWYGNEKTGSGTVAQKRDV